MSATTARRHARRLLRQDGDRRTVEAYLDRLGLPAEPPSAQALTRLHRAHVERVPYETFWLHLGEPLGIDPSASMRHVARGGRGGYCFHLNGAFSELLTHLGYRVTRHVAAVHDGDVPTDASWGNHVALVVHDLVGFDNPSGRWYVDVGLGDALHAPLPIVTGEHRDRVMRFTLSTLGGGAFHLGHDPAGSFAGVAVEARPASMPEFAGRHLFNVTSPESSFARTVTAQRRHADGVDLMRGCVLTRRRLTATDTSTQVFARCGEWLDGLDEIFGIRLDARADATAELWRRVLAGHRQWLGGVGAPAALASPARMLDGCPA